MLLSSKLLSLFKGKNFSILKKAKFRSLYTVSLVIETKVVIGWLNYNFECDWLI